MDGKKPLKKENKEKDERNLSMKVKKSNEIKNSFLTKRNKNTHH